MIKILKIKNFESHKDTTFEFGPGFNCIHGKSNNGKSSALRALELVGYGIWAAGENKKKGIHGPIRIGASFTEVYAESDIGYVKVKRGKGTNEWEVKDFRTDEVFNYKNPGAGSVSKAQEILGLETMKIADQSIRFNWSDQRDKHFLIEEVEGKNSTPSFVAAVLDEVGGLSGCEDLIRTLASDKSKLEQKMKKAAEEATATEEELEKFKGLDEKIVQANSVEKQIDKVLEKLKQVKSARELQEKISSLHLKIKEYSNLDSQIEKRKKAEVLLKEAAVKCSSCIKAFKINNEIKDMIDDLSSAKERVAELEKVDVLEMQDLLGKSEDLFISADDCRGLNSKIRRKRGVLDRKPKDKIDFREVGSMLNSVVLKVSDILNIRVAAKNIRVNISKLEDKKVGLSKSDASYIIAKEEYESLLESIGNICPLCNQEMSDKCREAIVEGV